LRRNQVATAGWNCSRIGVNDTVLMESRSCITTVVSP